MTPGVLGYSFVKGLAQEGAIVAVKGEMRRSLMKEFIQNGDIAIALMADVINKM